MWNREFVMVCHRLCHCVFIHSRQSRTHPRARTLAPMARAFAGRIGVLALDPRPRTPRSHRDPSSGMWLPSRTSRRLQSLFRPRRPQILSLGYLPRSPRTPTTYSTHWIVRRCHLRWTTRCRMAASALIRTAPHLPSLEGKTTSLILFAVPAMFAWLSNTNARTRSINYSSSARGSLSISIFPLFIWSWAQRSSSTRSTTQTLRRLMIRIHSKVLAICSTRKFLWFSVDYP